MTAKVLVTETFVILTILIINSTGSKAEKPHLWAPRDK